MRGYARAARTIGVVGLAAVVIALAFQELRSRTAAGGGSASGISVANYRAVAKAGGGPAPGFSMSSLAGDGQISLADYSGKTVVLNFWASWCAPCRVEASDLERTWERYRARGVQFLGVDYRDNDAAGRAFVSEFGITYPSVSDPSGELAYDYDLLGLPTTMVIAPDGIVVYKFTGKIDAAILDSALGDVLPLGSG